MFLRLHVTSRKTIFFVMRTVRIYNRNMSVAETRDIHDGENFFVGTYFRHFVCVCSHRKPHGSTPAHLCRLVTLSPPSHFLISSSIYVAFLVREMLAVFSCASDQRLELIDMGYKWA